MKKTLVDVNHENLTPGVRPSDSYHGIAGIDGGSKVLYQSMLFLRGDTPYLKLYRCKLIH